MPIRLLAAALTLVVLAGCGTRAAASGFRDGRLNVVTAFYPLEFLSERIGGPQVHVTDLTKPGAEPHDVELNPRQVGTIADAGLVAYLRGFQPAVDDAVAQEAKGRAFDAGQAVPLLPLADGTDGKPVPGADHPETAGSGMDPHVWLDPVRFATIADQIGRRLGQADPAHAADYTARAAADARRADRAEHRDGRRPAAVHPARDRHQPQRVQLPGHPLRPDPGRDHRHLPRGRAVAAADGPDRPAGARPPAPLRSSSRPWSAPRSPRPSPARWARGRPYWIRSRV